ncbi:3'(2'),5'-bisphosphate nucleotidase [Rippkaea orientalis PCC 8801]|uniref:3'(2'),5'-bisphosphate nucleotidase n=1 Tax=Rippkaea orientalis (strain PCC 8801 / RF-1) TaxID=41431 RepID=B7K3W0_RIPO1|nr:3'(2'),5'-bisphosphate nucleotidase [Rippkaea orientalis]ACK66500.1 3'(2'),5'-bisphosphate nucleotidase [Rippkaea orientalis PCC 8801]
MLFLYTFTHNSLAMIQDKEAKIAIAAVTTAAKLCQQVRHSQAFPTLQKADTSPVTIADFGAQAVICQALSEAFPQDPVIAEEDASILIQPEFSAILGQITAQVQQLTPQISQEAVIQAINWGNAQIAPRYWTLDPIDGTKGFIRGDQYAIALALVENGTVKLGVMGCPALPSITDGTLGVIFVAVRGQGVGEISLSNGEFTPIQVNAFSDPKQLVRIESVESTHSDRSVQAILDQMLGWTQLPTSMDSQAKYSEIARGKADLYLRVLLPQFKTKKENIWDHAAGVIIVEEAGGKVSDLDGKPLDFSLGSKLSENRGILANNGIIHQQVLEMIAEIEKY